jgi:Ca-activated chloride channel family protein
MKKLVIALVAALTVLANQEPDFKSATRLVQIYATVFDHGGRTVAGLGREQFEVRDDGAVQPISVFEPTEKSVSCALLLDTTGSMAESIPILKNAAREFITAMRDGDSVGVFAFNDHLDELAEVSTDRSVARRALTRLRASGRTALFDSISQLALQFEKRPGKKVIVVLTDGGDNASSLNRQSAAQRARKAGIPVFAVAEGEALRDSAASGLLHELAEATGGHMYRASNAKEIDRVFLEITEEMRNSYLLAFNAPEEVQSPPWHQLQVVVRNSHPAMRVRARTGYQGE